MQEALFQFTNPLNLRLGRDFFSSIPKLPGVYRMFGAPILYQTELDDLITTAQFSDQKKELACST